MSERNKEIMRDMGGNKHNLHYPDPSFLFLGRDPWWRFRHIDIIALQDVIVRILVLLEPCRDNSIGGGLVSIEWYDTGQIPESKDWLDFSIFRRVFFNPAENVRRGLGAS